MFFCVISAGGNVALAWVSVSTWRASFGDSCSIGLPPEPFSLFRKLCTWRSAVIGWPAANAPLMLMLNNEAVNTVVMVFMVLLLWSEKISRYHGTANRMAV